MAKKAAKKSTKKKKTAKKGVKKSIKKEETISQVEDKAIDNYVKNLDVYTCDVADGHVFYCANGENFKNVVDLGNSMDSMDEDSFSHHVNEGKNDFASWVYDCVGDVELANALRQLDTLEDMKRELKLRLGMLEDS